MRNNTQKQSGQEPGNNTGPRPSSSALSSPAKIAGSLGVDTPSESETPALVAERYNLSLEVKRAERRLAVIDPILKARTGARQTGDFIVTFTSNTKETVDTDKCREILGDKCPIKLSPVTRLTVVPA